MNLWDSSRDGDPIQYRWPYKWPSHVGGNPRFRIPNASEPGPGHHQLPGTSSCLVRAEEEANRNGAEPLLAVSPSASRLSVHASAVPELLACPA